MSGKSSKLLIDEEPLQVLPTLATKLGLNRAMFLQQLHYWLKKPSAHERDGERWIYNTFEEWHEQFPFWSAEAIRKIASQLQNKGLIKTTSRHNERKGDRTLWYTINYEAFNALLEASPEAPGDPSPEAPDKSTEAPYQPDKSTEQPDKSTELEPDKSTERYQRLPETNNRDSDLQSGDGQKKAAPEKESKQEKPMKMGAFGCKELMDRVNTARAAGKNIHDPPDLANYGKFFSSRAKRHEIATLLRALDYLVAKASDEVDGEPKAWCGFDTALDHVVIEGWRPKANLRLVSKADAARDDLEERVNRKLEQAILNGASQEEVEGILAELKVEAS